ncbi:MAG: alcohol dehydrogenase class IV, partial [Francisellaceae bacterium]
MWHKKYQFNFPTTIRFGANIVAELSEFLEQQNVKKPLIVTDSILSKLPIIKGLSKILDQGDFSYFIFDDVSKNPVESDVTKGVKAYHKNQCDSIIGIGGGASIDVARAIVLMANHPGNLFDYEDGTGGDKNVIDANIPYFIAIPTTSGTGSEVGRSSIISDEKTHQKRII